METSVPILQQGTAAYNETIKWNSSCIDRADGLRASCHYKAGMLTVRYVEATVRAYSEVILFFLSEGTISSAFISKVPWHAPVPALVS